MSVLKKKLESPYAAYVVCEMPARMKINGKTDQIKIQTRQIFVRHEGDEESIRDKIYHRDFKPIKMVGFEGRKDLVKIAALVKARIDGDTQQTKINDQEAEIERLRKQIKSEGKPNKAQSASGEAKGKDTGHAEDRDVGKQKS